MKSHHKIIFSGPVGAGKTTAITSISDIPTIRTEETATDETKNMKETTTVALDYGAIILPDETRIHLYGTPGQERFDFMWDILTKGGIGLILLIDGANANALDNFKFFMNSFKSFIEKTSIVVGITKQDIGGKYELEDFINAVSGISYTVPIYEVDARSRKDISLMVETLLYSLDPKLKIND